MKNELQEIIRMNDDKEQIAHRAGYQRCMEDLVSALKYVPSFTIVGMIPVMAALREKARAL